MKQIQNIYTNKNTSFSKGVTLIELAIAIIVIGTLISAFAGGFLSYLEQTRQNVTEDRLAEIEQALYTFQSINNRYPCPARVTAGVDSANFGIEAHTITGGGADCNNNPNVYSNGGTDFIFDDSANSGGSNNASSVAIGHVPVRALGLPDNYVADAWGGRFTYAVTSNQATDNYATNSGAIQIVLATDAVLTDSSGNPDTKDFIVFSHGKNQIGAYTLGDATNAPSLLQACPDEILPTAASESKEAENCDTDAQFRQVFYASNIPGREQYDDIFIFAKRQAGDPDVTIPAGMVSFFDETADGTNNNSNDCPAGWTEYVTLVPEAQGRLVAIRGTGTPADIAASTGISGGASLLRRMDDNIATGGGVGAEAFMGGNYRFNLGNVSRLPPHRHEYPTPAGSQILRSADISVPGVNYTVFTGFGPMQDTTPIGNNNPVRYVPAFIAMTACRKD